MLRIGLTGGIGSGKTAVADLLAEHGAVIIDADLLARRAVEPGSPGLARLVEEFGPGVLTPQGGLNRPVLGEIVFSDPQARARLNAIVHPEVRRLAALAERAASPDAIVVHVIPLLVETGQQDLFDLIVVVDVDPATQLRRVTERDGLDEDQVRARIDAQAGRPARLAVADVVIDNSGSPAELEASVAALWRRLRTTA
ncbi:MAG: dephospho-CoA kinase, long form [Propionibacteriaceae bacterium]|nr:dephospho-CoA kinase, long form [Propionibacteriaceae bacterium]